MDEARSILLRYDEGLVSCAEACIALSMLATRNEIPHTSAIGFICQIATEEHNKLNMGVTNGNRG